MAADETIKSEEEIKQVQKPSEPMVMPTEFDLLVVNMDKVLFEDKAKSMIAPGPMGDFAILPGHTPLFTTLKQGKLMIEGLKNRTEIEIDGGVAKIMQSRVKILVGF